MTSTATASQAFSPRVDAEQSLLRLLELIRGSKTVLLESNHDVNMLEIGKYPPQLKRRIRGKLGHLSNDDAGRAAEFLVRLGTERIILGHLSEENNYPELAYQAVRNEINFSPDKYQADNLDIRVASRVKPSCLVEF